MNGPKVGISCLSKIWLNAGNSENPTVPVFEGAALVAILDAGNNPVGADNQQERPAQAGILRDYTPDTYTGK